MTAKSVPTGRPDDPAQQSAGPEAARGTGFIARIKTAALDPFRGYANAIRDELPEAITVLDAFQTTQPCLNAKGPFGRPKWRFGGVYPLMNLGKFSGTGNAAGRLGRPPSGRLWDLRRTLRRGPLGHLLPGLDCSVGCEEAASSRWTM